MASSPVAKPVALQVEVVLLSTLPVQAYLIRIPYFEVSFDVLGGAEV